MNPYPGFTVRSYPAFRAARLYRVFVAPDALYFIRTKGLISASDAGSEIAVDPGQAAVAALIRWFGRKSLEAARAEVEQSDPEAMVKLNKKHFKIAVDDLIKSSLEPPSLFGGHGHYYATWKVVTRRIKDAFQIEDAESLEVVLDHLPALLGSRLTVTVDRPYGRERIRSRLMG